MAWCSGGQVEQHLERGLTLRQDESDPTPSLQDQQRAGLGAMSVDSFGVAANVWWSRHFRFSANYLINYLDGDMPHSA